MRDDITGKRAALAEVRAEQQAIVREAELADRRLAALAADRAGWSERQQGARQPDRDARKRIAEAKRERAELENAPAVFAEKRAGADQRSRRRAEGDRRACADRLAGSRKRARRSRPRRTRRARSRKRRARGTGARRGALRRRQAPPRRRRPRNPRHAGDRAVRRSRELAEIKPDEALPELAEIEAKLERLRRERERLGAVNLRAEEELREVEAQHTSLTTERDDLVEAIKKLRLGIQSLNREARERLLASFEQVNEHFQQLFTQLFGGGTAELQLIESDDPLEAGLEILAKPPGKKPATLSLLSGGEQALTALALIFAVFLTNPAPICVLDEVDAPLDDHNVERFCDLLDEMTRSTDTRFVIITHNPITMARMNRLLRGDHGRARRVAAGLGRSRSRGAVPRGRLSRCQLTWRNVAATPRDGEKTCSRIASETSPEPKGPGRSRVIRP